jgi:hypothetical protein
MGRGKSRSGEIRGPPPSASVETERGTVIGSSSSRRRALAGMIALTMLIGLGQGFAHSVAAVAANGAVIEEAAILAAPAEDATILLRVARDVRLAITGRAENGYYPVEFRGLTGWLATGSIATSGDDSGVGGDPGTLIANATIDLLAEAHAAATVLDTITAGGDLHPTGAQSNGFIEVTFRGSTGWAAGESLRVIAGGGPRDPDDYTEDDLIQIINDAADYYGQSRKDMQRVARCESQLVPTAVNPATGDSGLFQFNPGTWLTTPYAEYDIFDPRASAYAAGWMWSVGRRNEWVCQ